MAAALAALPEPQPVAADEPTQITLVAVGDILLGRRLGVEMKESGDYSLPFHNISFLLTPADIAFGNFEGVFCEKPPWPTTGMVFRLHPDSVKSLVAGGFDVVSVANNHFGDGGNACVTYSLAHLAAHGIAAAGAGNTYEEAHAPAILERLGVKFAFLAYTYEGRNDSPPAPKKNDPAAESSPANAEQTAAASTAVPGRKSFATPRPTIAARNPQNVRRDVAAARQVADVVIVSVHDGAEYLQRVAKETQEFSRAAIDAGATAVLGHHPHVPQRIEQYNGGWIFYSLGNFVFQQNTPPAVKHSLIARLTFTGKTLTKVEALPAYIETFARPRPATPEESARILKSIGVESPLLWQATAK